MRLARGEVRVRGEFGGTGTSGGSLRSRSRTAEICYDILKGEVAVRAEFGLPERERGSWR